MTTTRHPAPSGCRKEPRVLSLRSNNTEPTKRMPAGTSATSALDNVAFITRLGERGFRSLIVRSRDATPARAGSRLNPRGRAYLYRDRIRCSQFDLRRELSCGLAYIVLPVTSSHY